MIKKKKTTKQHNLPKDKAFLTSHCFYFVSLRSAREPRTILTVSNNVNNGVKYIYLTQSISPGKQLLNIATSMKGLQKGSLPKRKKIFERFSCKDFL